MSTSNQILTSSVVPRGTAQVGFAHPEAHPHRLLLTGTIRSFFTLAKPEITFMVMISAGVGSLLASGSLRTVTLAHTVLGIGLLAAGTSALNQYLERELDGRMRRTARRPLPAGELTARQALIFGMVVLVSGVFYVLLFLNTLTALLGFLTVISYLFVYTPLKSKTRLCTFFGAFPGAAPVLMGWAAATKSLSLEAWALYAILFLWQFPHFYAIGWLYREDYARAGMRMLPSVNEDDAWITFRLILISTQLLILTSLLFTFVAHAGILYFAPSLILGFGFYYFAYQASRSRSKFAAKGLLHASVIYLPLLYLFMILDRVKL